MKIGRLRILGEFAAGVALGLYFEQGQLLVFLGPWVVCVDGRG
jgi:hypothetical protein